MSGVVPLLLGGLFGIGLVLAGMTDPAYIRGFLDVTGDWRPELAFVMASALVISALFFQLIQPKMARPLFAEGFSMPTASQIDGRLIGGAFLFGMGWAVSGYCPGAWRCQSCLPGAEGVWLCGCDAGGVQAGGLARPSEVTGAAPIIVEAVYSPSIPRLPASRTSGMY